MYRSEVRKLQLYYVFWQIFLKTQIKLKQEEFHLFQTQNRNTDTFFCRRTHEQKKHGFTFLESMKVQKIRIQSFCKLKILRHAQIQSVKTAKCFRKHQSHFLQTQTVHKCSCQQNVFSKRWGWAQRAQKRLPPFFGKNILLKRTFVCRLRL